MIKQFKDYNETQGYGDFRALPKGAYVLKVMGVETCENSRGAYLKIGMDVAEGEYANFFTDQYKNNKNEDKRWQCNYLLSLPADDGSEQDGWTKRKFKTFTEALEDSNDGYHFDWDETKFKGKLIGGLFNIREFQKRDGSIGSAVNLANVTSVEKVKKGEYKLPADKLMERQPEIPSSADFMKMSDELEEDLPFH